jgi:exoribonuclease-2
MQKHSLIIFKSKPAKIVAVLDKKVHIETMDGKNIKLPPKNVQWLLDNDKDFDLEGLSLLTIDELDMTWELLQESETTSLEELSELLFDTNCLSEAYTVWQLVSDGEYFSFNDDYSIKIHSPAEREQIVSDRLEKIRKTKEIIDFVERIKAKTYIADDEKFIKEIESLATLKSNSCRLFKHLNMEETESNAYRLLLEIGYWDEYNNPYLHRFGADLESNAAPFEYNYDTDSDRVDMTNMVSYAIDDEGSNDPDDAISWDFENNKMWVHVADTSSSIEFGSEVDLEARARGSNLYVPEHIISMLPSKATDVLGLGLQETSPAISIGFEIDESGSITSVEIVFSKIKVTRLSYEYAESNMKTLVLGDIPEYALRFTKCRLQNGAVELDFPEVKISLDDDKKVIIAELPRIGSRTLVRDTMLMAGVAVGDYSLDNNIPVPFSTQPEHELSKEDLESLKTPSSMFAARKKLRRGKHSVQADKHGGMGLDNYVQVTSPLRRYLDLVVHYQLRRHIHGQELIGVEELAHIMAEVDIPIRSNRQTERYTNMHWKLVYLLQNDNYRVDATIVEMFDKNKLIVSLNSLAMTKKMIISDSVGLNSTILLENSNVNLVNQEAFFKIIDNSY